jgi:hypothetical protein
MAIVRPAHNARQAHEREATVGGKTAEQLVTTSCRHECSNRSSRGRTSITQSKPAHLLHVLERLHAHAARRLELRNAQRALAHESWMTRLWLQCLLIQFAHKLSRHDNDNITTSYDTTNNKNKDSKNKQQERLDTPTRTRTPNTGHTSNEHGA